MFPVSYLVHYDTLLQNETDIITKYDNYFLTKSDKSLLWNASGGLLENAAVLLQNAFIITKCVSTNYYLDNYSIFKV